MEQADLLRRVIDVLEDQEIVYLLVGSLDGRSAEREVLVPAPWCRREACGVSPCVVSRCPNQGGEL